MEDILILYAIRNGLSDPVVAIIASFIHLAMPFMILGKYLVSRVGLARTWALGWFARYLSASLLVAAPLVSAVGGPAVQTALIVLGAFGFAAFRSVGAVSNTPLIGEVTTGEERGRFMSGTFVRGNSSHLLTLVLVILIMSAVDSLWVYQMLIAAGCIVGFYASTQLARIPESLSGMESARTPILAQARRLLRERRSRKLLFAWSAGFTSFTIVIPFMVITLKNGYGVSDYTALSYSLLVLLGGVASALANGVVSDRVGPRPLLVIYAAGLVAVGAFWAIAPATYLPGAIAVTFFIAGLCKVGIVVGLGHYFLSTVSENDRVGGSLFMRIFGGAAAGLSGSVIGGGVLQFLQSNGFTGLDPYRGYFRIALVVLVGLFLLIYRLERINDWRVSSIVGLLFSPRDLRALWVLSRLKRTESSSDEVRGVMQLGETGSSLPEAELREYLDSPNLSVRVRTLHALRNFPIGSETVEAVIEELKRGYYTSAWIAAELLGEQGIMRAIPLLRHGLDSGDHFLCGKCMQALVRLRDTDSYERIISIFEETTNPRIAIYGANALSRMGGPGTLERILEKSLEPTLPTPVVDEVLTAAATSAGVGAQFYRFLRLYNRNSGEAFEELLPALSPTLFETNGELVRSESVNQERPLHYFRMALLRSAEESSGEHAQAVRTILDKLDENELPRKLAFCLALILSSREESAANAYPIE